MVKVEAAIITAQKAIVFIFPTPGLIGALYTNNKKREAVNK
jgi:hypothetical protein